MQHDEIKGFTDQSARNKQLVNANKEVEERVLRLIDNLYAQEGLDSNMLAAGRSKIIVAFMLLNRAIFQPTRVALPEDAAPSPDDPPAPPPVHIGEVFREMHPDKNHEEVVHDGQGNELVADGPHWRRKSEVDEYVARLKEHELARKTPKKG